MQKANKSTSTDSMWNIWQTNTLPAPRTLRETFQLLALYQPETGLDALLARIDFNGMPLSQSYEAVLNRQPEGIPAVKAASLADPRQRFRQALLSDEFQGKLVRLLLHAYPEKKRNVFIHIPKCAGADLSTHLIPRYLPLGKAMESSDWTSKSKMLEWISGITKVVPMFNEFFVYGHTEFGDYIRKTGTRSSDHCFTVVRDPLDLLISQANYNVGLLQKDPTASRPDTRQVMRLLELESIPDPLAPDMLREFARKALLDRRVAQPNRICAYLGDGKASMSITNLVTQNVEVTDTSRYNAWIKERWGITAETRQNASGGFLTRADAVQHSDVLAPAMAEDQIVFDLITKALDRTGALSISGAALVHD